MAQANQTIHQMTDQVEVQLKQALQELNPLSFTWVTILKHKLERNLKISIGSSADSVNQFSVHCLTLHIYLGGTLSALLSLVTPFVVLYQGLRFKFIWSLLSTGKGRQPLALPACHSTHARKLTGLL